MHSRLNDNTLNAILITNKFCKKDKLLENEKDLAQQKLSSKPAKAAETTETVEAPVQKRQNDKSKTAKDHVSKRTWLEASDSQLNNSDEN